MPANAVVRAWIDEKTKKKATVVLKQVGLTPSAAFRLMMTRIANERLLPFELLIPNAETVEALQAVRRGEVTEVASFDELIEKLNADD
jgi:DNA-damage-inducible protein J